VDSITIKLKNNKTLFYNKVIEFYQTDKDICIKQIDSEPIHQIPLSLIENIKIEKEIEKKGKIQILS